MPKKAEGKVVEATGTAAQGGARGNAVEQAMAEAAAQAMAEGITDQDEIRQRMLDAREQVMRPAASDEE